MNKIEFVKVLAEKAGVRQADAKFILESAIELLKNELVNGNDIKLSGLGIFKTQMRKGRTGRNPATGDPVEIPDRMALKFTPAASLKEAVKEMPVG